MKIDQIIIKRAASSMAGDDHLKNILATTWTNMITVMVVIVTIRPLSSTNVKRAYNL
jgi:hypothetical protein